MNEIFSPEGYEDMLAKLFVRFPSSASVGREKTRTRSERVSVRRRAFVKFFIYVLLIFYLNDTKKV